MKQSLFYDIDHHLQGGLKNYLETSVDTMLDPQRRFLTNCIKDSLIANYSLDTAAILLRTIVSNPVLERMDKNKKYSSFKDENIKIFNDYTKACTHLREKFQPIFKNLVDTKTFHDLRPDLAKIARVGFFTDTFRRGPRTIKKYISILNLSQDDRGILRKTLKSDGKKWMSINKKYGRELWTSIEWQYKVANCEHIVKLGPQGGFRHPVRPDEKTLADRKNCREEQNLQLNNK